MAGRVSCAVNRQTTFITSENLGNFPINQMVLMMINNRAKEVMEKKQEHEQEHDDPSDEDSEDSEDEIDPKQKAKELNQLIKQMSVKLPRSECDEYESNDASGDSTTKTINNK